VPPPQRWMRGTGPPWWPEGEPWPPVDGRRWPQAARRFRRRIVIGAIALLLVVVLLGVAIGAAIGWHGDRRPNGGPRGGPGALLGFLVLVAVVGGIASWIAYRRIGAPAGRLLDAAQRVGAGERDVHVEVAGPRELRSLIESFNGMATSLRDADEQRRRFLADVTHELRTPIAVLQSQIEAQLDGIHPSDEAHLRSLLDETHLLGRLVEDLGTVALADAGRLTLHLESSDPTVVVSDAVEAAASLADDKGVTLAVDAPPAAPPLDLDPTRIRQVVANLLTNAIRHTPAGGQVTVAIRATPGGGASVTVWDTGPGIAPADLDAVFDRYTKAADSGGSGLGLAIARDLVRAHGGSITATNRVGGGAEITFELPADLSRRSPGQAASAPGA